MPRRLSFLLLLSLCGASARSAQAAPKIIYQKHSVVTFGNDTVSGDLSRPDGQYLESQKRLRHQRLIRLRDNFRAEILASIHLL